MPMIAELSTTLQSPSFLTTLQAVAQHAREALPLANGRIAKAVEIVLSGGVTLQDGNHAVVASQTTPHTNYSLNGACPCEDAQRSAPDGLCKHRLAVGLFRRTTEALTRIPLPEGEGLPPVEDTTPMGLDRRFLTSLHGKVFVRYAGLLALAHDRGLVQLDARIEFHSDALVLASATATFSDGRTFTEWADATPTNVSAHVKPHWMRMALTRAKGRALRDALNIGLCTVEELGGEE